MYRILHIYALLSSLLLSAPALANEMEMKKAVDPQVMMDTYNTLATPGEPHKHLASLAGTWTTQTKEWMEPGKPPTESTGICEHKMLLDGRYMQ